MSEGLPIDLTARAAEAYLARNGDALAAIPEGPSMIRLRLLTARSLAAGHLDLELASEVRASVDEVATELGGNHANAYAQLAWGFCHAGPEHAEDRVTVAAEILATAELVADHLLVPGACLLQMIGLLEQGEIRALDTTLLEQLATRSAAGPWANPAKWFYTLRSILDGDIATAEKQVEDLYAVRGAGETNALALYTTQMGMIRWMQGRIEGAEEGFLAARRAYPEQIMWAASLVWLWFLQGRRSMAESLLQTLPEPESLPRDRHWLSTIVLYAEIAAFTGSRSRAQRLRELLLPHAKQLVAVGVGVAFWGTAARSLGLIEERLGNLDSAREHLELAIEMSRRIGALAWHAEAQIELAEFGIRQELSDIPSYELLAEARKTCEARGFEGLARKSMHMPRIQVLGTFEVISLCGVRADWTSRKARELLKMLVAARGMSTSREVYMEVLWPGEAPSALSNRFSVAVNVVRRALDPQRLLPTQHHVVTEGDAIRLNLDHVEVDLERFFTFARQSDQASHEVARRLYRGDAFSDELYADWAVQVRDHAQYVRDSLNSAGEN